MKLPSNKKFGFTFSFVFSLLFIFFFYKDIRMLAYFFCALAIILFLISCLKQDLLYFFNLLWYKFGLLLGKVIGPIVISVIFFLLITPISIITRVFGRDELKLKVNKEIQSYWIIRDDDDQSTKNFKNQY
tara:strand:- start:697 stop:1086 length:390 start_codon:yes stop_codon:yes gene_type:complete